MDLEISTVFRANLTLRPSRAGWCGGLVGFGIRAPQKSFGGRPTHLGLRGVRKRGVEKISEATLI